MTSRLYRTTRPLAAQVALVLDRLGIGVLGSPTTLALIALYLSGLILLEERQTQTRVALFLPGRCHDALNPSDGGFRIPVAFRLWRPKRSCAPGAYRTKLELWRRSCSRRSSVRGSKLATSSSTPTTAPGGSPRWSRGWAWCGSRYAPSEDDRRLVRQAAFGGRVGQDAASEVAQEARDACGGRERLRSQVRCLLAVGRDQKPSLGNYEYIVTNELEADLTTVAERKVSRWSIETLFSRHQAVCGLGGVPMPGGSGDGSPRGPRFAHLRGIANDAPLCGGERGFGQGALAVGGDARRRISSSAPQSLSTSSTSHRVSPVTLAPQELQPPDAALGQQGAEFTLRRFCSFKL